MTPLSHQKEALVEHVKEHTISWPQAWLGEWQDTPIPGEFDVNGIPATFLVDPEGIVVAAGLRGRPSGIPDINLAITYPIYNITYLL